MAPAVQRIVRSDFSAGMFPEIAPELVPPNGALDISNGLIDEQQQLYRRGGAKPITSGAAMEQATMLWSGYLKHGGLQTIQAAAAHTYKIPESGIPSSLGFTVTSARTPFRGQVFNGVLYMPGGTTWDGEKSGTIEGTAEAGPPKLINAPKVPFYATAGSRLLAGEGSRIYFSNVPQLAAGVLKWEETNYHELPDGVSIVGMEGWRTSCVVFTTAGVYIIGGLNHELVDAEGNVQQTLDRYSADALLWGDAGIASWAGGLVVPCHDDVYLMELGVSSEKAAPFVKISGAITNLYRRYLSEGLKPGAAAVYRGHYFLPIIRADGIAVVDVLVCRLGGSYAWTHLTGSGAQVRAFATTSAFSANPAPIPITFIGANDIGGVLQASTYFTPGAAALGDGAAGNVAVSFEVVFGALATGNNLRANLVTKARLRYRLEGAAEPTLQLSYNADVVPTEGWEVLPGEAPVDPTAAAAFAWPVRKKDRFAVVRAFLAGTASYASLRSLELFVRPDGKLF